jgi:hypothetical protein
MFESHDYPKPLDEALFDSWLEAGRSSKIPYAFLLIVWDELEGRYLPFYAEKREEFGDFEKYGGSSPGRQLLVATYDLYSESRID